MIWFSVIISLATGLADLGFIKWMTIKLGSGIQGFGAIESFIVLGILYIYVHYLFATATGHVAALYAPFAATAIAAGAPPMMVAICFGIFSNLMWGIPSMVVDLAPFILPRAILNDRAFTKLTSVW